MSSTPLPPGPTNREMITRIGSIQAAPLAFLTSLSNRFGGIACFHVFTLPVIVITHPDGVRHVLQENSRRYSKDTLQYNALADITGKGLLTNDGEDWLKQRRLAQPAFTRARLLSLDQIIVPATQAMLAGWEANAARHETLDIDREMMQLTLEIVGKALFSVDLRGEARDLTGAVLTTLDTIVYRARNMVTPPPFIPTPRNLRFQKALGLLEQAVYGMIAERKSNAGPGDDLLGMFLRARDGETGQPMSERQIRDELMTMLVAGHETVASALTWVWMLLSLHPAVRERLTDEVRDVLQGRPPVSSDLPDLPYTAAVFNEGLRLYPPAWLITRKALEDDEVQGFRIPRGALVILSPYVIHRQTADWPAPETFQPERFLGSADINRYAYIPFGAGPRLCIGSQFAQIEAQLILACIAQRFCLNLAGQPPQVDALVTLRPRGGMHMAPVRIQPVPMLS
jgi:cytochrome P450